MRVKRFNNLWTMGLILFGGILLAFYIAKIFFPEFIVGVAEIPSIVKLGNYVDSHKWAFYLIDGIVSTFIAFIYCCACCRKPKVSLKSLVSIVVCNIILYLVSAFLPHQYTIVNCAIFVFMPFIVCYIENNICKETFISTSICVFADLITQVISMEIRDVTIMMSQFNSATFFILLIDMVIWRFLFYSYFNYKNNKGE